MDAQSLLAALIVAGLANGVVIGAIVMLRNRDRRSGLALGALMLVAAVTGGLILLYGSIPPLEAPLVLAVELFLTLSAGPLLLIGAAGLVGREVAGRRLLLAVCAAIAFTALASWLVRYDPVVPAVITQFGYTAAAWRIYLRREPHADRRLRRFRQDRIALALLLAMLALHAVQLAKMVQPRSDAMAWAVPAVLALIMAIAASALLAWAARRIELGSADAAPSPARERVDGLIRQHLHDPDLSGETLASLAGLSLAELRAAYAAEGGVAAAIRRMRVEKAAGELASAEERRTSIDAIALGCGFRSRSAFYEAFRKQHGCNPGDFRQRAQPDLS